MLQFHASNLVVDPPENHWIKCNTNGACRGNPGPNTYGFFLRDSREDLIYAESQQIELNTNLEAETEALWRALQHCLNHNFAYIKLETDSMSVKNMIKEKWSVPWETMTKMEEIREFTKQLNVHLTHIFREANQLADCMANIAFNHDDIVQVHNFNQLASWGRRILNCDKSSIPTIRVKTRKIQTSDNHVIEESN